LVTDKQRRKHNLLDRDNNMGHYAVKLYIMHD